MADGANLDLTFTSGLDASVQKSFAAIEKLLNKVEKSMGSLNSSMEKIATASGKLADSINSITVAAVKAADKVDKLGDSFVETQEKQKAASKQMKKTSLEQADIYRVTSKQYMTNARLADKYSVQLEHINNTVKRGTKEYSQQVAALTKTEQAYQNYIKSVDMAVGRVAKKEAELASLREKRKEYEGKPADLARYDAEIAELERRIERLRPLTTEEGHRAAVASFDFVGRFEENLKKIKKSQILTETEKHIQNLSTFGEHAVAIYNKLTMGMADSSAQRKLIEKDVTNYVKNLDKELLQLDTDIRYALNNRTDKNDFTRVKTLQDQRAELYASAYNPATAFDTYTNRKATIINEAVAVSKYAQSVYELRKEYGQWAVDIFEDVAVGIDESSHRFKQELDNVKKYGKQYYDELSRIDSEIKAIQHDLGSSTLSDGKREDLDKRLLDSVNAKARLMDTVTGANAISEYHAKRAGLGSDVIPLSKLEQYTNKLSKYGDVAKSLFNYLNVGLDENSEQVKRNYEAVEKYFKHVNKKRDELQAERTDKLARREAAITDEEIALVDKGLDALDKRITKWDNKISADGILEGFFGHKSGRDAAFGSLYELMGELPVFKKRLDEIRDSTVHGSVDQRQAITKLKKDFDEYNDVLKVTDTLTAVSAANLDELKRNNAAEDTIKKHQTALRELEGIRKNLTDTFSGVSDFGASTNLSNLMKRYSGILTSDTALGKQARGLFSNIDVSKLDELDKHLGNIQRKYNNVIPTLAHFAEVNGLSAEQVAKLNSAEFIQQAALMNTKAGVRKLAEEYLGFHKTSRTSITLFDRMAASMGNMARYAFGASIYYAFENALFSAIDSVAQFDQSLKNLQAITNATDAEVALLGDEIKRVAVETKYGLKEVAEGATIIGQAGFSATETVSILGSAMNLAQGSMSTVTASADLLTTVIAAFNLTASDAARVADNMAAAMNYSKLDIDKLRTAFNYVGPVAMDAGLSLNEMSAALMVLANHGMKASTIGTSLRNVFSQIASPSTALKTAFEGNSEALTRLQDKSTSIVEKFTILNEVLGTSSNLYEMFGLRAAGTVSILMKYPQQLQEMIDGLYTLGDAERMADKQMEGFANRLKNFKAAMEVAAVTMTERPAGALSNLVKWATEVVTVLTSVMDSSFGDAIAYVTAFATSVAGLVAGGKLFVTLFGKAVPFALSTFTTALALNGAAMMGNKDALVANIKSGRARITAITASTAATTTNTVVTSASSAVTRTDTVVTNAHTGATAANTAAITLRTKALRAMGVAMTFLSRHPFILALSAVALTIGAVTGALAAFRKEEDKEYKASVQWMKQKREQLGILSAAIEANRNLSENNEATRMSNNVYVATKVPFIAEELLGNFDKDKTHEILTGAYQTIQDELVETASSTMLKAAERIENLKEGRTAIQQAFRDNLKQVGESKFTVSGGFIGFRNTRPEDIVSQRQELSDDFYEQMATNGDAIRAANAEMREGFGVIEENAKRITDGLIKEYGSIDKAWEKLTGRTVDSLDRSVEYIDLYTAALDQGLVDTVLKASPLLLDLVDMFREASIAEQKLARSTKDADYALKELPAVLNELGISGGTRLINIFKNVDGGMLMLAKAADKYQKTLKKLSEQKGAMTGEAFEQAKSEATIEFYNTLTKEYDKTYSRELEWIELRKKSAISANNMMVQSEEQRLQRQKAIELEYAKLKEDQAKKAITDELNILAAKAGIEGGFTQEQIDIILNPDSTQLDKLMKELPALKDILKSEGIMSGIKRYIDIVLNASNAQKELDKLPKVRFGTIAKNEYDAAKNKYDTSIAETERSYATGGMSYDDYVESKIAARQRLIEAEDAYVAKLLKTATTEADWAKYHKAYAALEENEAKSAHEAEMLRIEKARYKAEKAHNEKMFAIDAEVAALENRDMNESDRQTGLLKLEGKRIQQQIDYIKEQLESKEIKNDEKKQTELQLDLEKQKLELQKNQVAQERLAYEIRTKYIEQEYKYGLVSKEEYQKYLQKQIDEGKIDPYEGQRKQWLESDDWTDGVKEGLARILDDTKSMNEWIAEGVANFRNEWHSAIDDFVDACWDGTKSAEEIFKDFATNILMDWQKRIIKMYSDQMFDELIQPFLKGQGFGNIFNALGGGRVAQTAIGTTATAIDTPTPTVTPTFSVDTSGLQLNLSNTLQNVQSNVSAATAAQTASVENMATQSTSLITSMTNGATNLWSFLGNGFQSLWSTIGSGMSNMLSMIAFSMTGSSSNMSFWERWLTNSIGMGFKLVGSYAGGGSGGGYDFAGKAGVGNSLQLSDSFNGISDIAKNGIKFAKGGVFSGLSDFSNSIVSSPTLFTYGEHLKAFAKGGGLMGEAGPEAIMPLTRDSNGRLGVSAEGMGGAQCINNIYIETPEGYTAEQTSRVSNNNGGEDIMFTIVKQTAANVAQPGSPMYRAMQNTFGASQVLTSR